MLLLPCTLDPVSFFCLQRQHLPHIGGLWSYRIAHFVLSIWRAHIHALLPAG
eukprot:NODE_8507_length_380_cov_1.015385.p4 GENE.NODE_8507_length_380_cov_1.015385~~NODE_8507_length_380_cov_1.015385.p4  ORF type:complete len:52 (-),score=5.48 NODE_8507_length_380_cov_1.015385:119-274(-)